MEAEILPIRYRRREEGVRNSAAEESGGRARYDHSHNPLLFHQPKPITKGELKTQFLVFGEWAAMSYRITKSVETCKYFAQCLSAIKYPTENRPIRNDNFRQLTESCVIQRVLRTTSNTGIKFFDDSRRDFRFYICGDTGRIPPIGRAIGSLNSFCHKRSDGFFERIKNLIVFCHPRCLATNRRIELRVIDVVHGVSRRRQMP